MTTADVLGSSLAQELRQTAGTIALRALAQNQNQSLPKSEDKLVISLRSAFVDIYRLRLTHARLPTELWVHIWRPLSLVDRIAVSQVCFLWRTIALSCPRLWDELEIGYCPLHMTFPDCRYCHCCILRGLPLPSMTLNLLPLVLPRSQNLPLSLRFFCILQLTRPRIMDLLAGALHRLAKVEIDAERIDYKWDGEAVTVPFCSLTSLRELRLTSLTTFTRGVWPENVDLPNLERLHVSCVTFRDWAHPPLPNLTSLHIAATTLKEILGYLKAAPLLSELSFDASAVKKDHCDFWTRAECEAIYALVSCRRLSKIRVNGIPAGAKEWIHDMFHITSCPELSFQYSDSTCYDSSMAILEDIDGRVSLSLTAVDKKTITIQARGNCGRVRHLSGRFDIEAFFGASARLSAIAVHSLSLDYLVFIYLSATLPWSSTIESLTLYMPRWHLYPSFEHFFTPRNTKRYEWLRLTTITFEAPNDGYVVVPASVIRQPVRFVSPDGNLEKLVFRGVYGDSDSAYQGLARTIIPDCRPVSPTV
ncbi:hypothetical protein EXIGLDRAFT_833245 [Exidia glandulosa HHB12029]|uniref:F-box domain-containing protein n=1 Tax=Exidia glandulosa HHB12029 TaxID=1314781 RepID=A0A165KW12_EXIGL|nr:hypothetical protein EXIGLDRAFT_833245 [Exidia glandulosa HHB12029]